MHWSVGMLLHAVCVFFFKGEKKKPVERKISWVGGSQHIF